MRIILILMMVFGWAFQIHAQTHVKIKLFNQEKINGQLNTIEDDQFVLILEDSTKVYIPSEMVKKLTSYRPYYEYPRYDAQRNTWYFGALLDFNTTTGQPNQNLLGNGIHGLVGYDWNHRYSLDLSLGFRNMNIGSPEFHFPVNLAIKKYLNQRRYMPFIGLEAGFQWGSFKSFSRPSSPWSSWMTPTEVREGSGPSVTPVVGLRKTGKYGWDHIFSLGFHFQKFYSNSSATLPENLSELEVTYRRWMVRYGVIF